MSLPQTVVINVHIEVIYNSSERLADRMHFDTRLFHMMYNEIVDRACVRQLKTPKHF